MVEFLIPTLKGHVDKFVVVAVSGANIWIHITVVGVFLPSCLLNAILAVLTVRKLHSFRASFSAATYKMHLRLAACLSCQVLANLNFHCYEIFKKNYSTKILQHILESFYSE